MSDEAASFGFVIHDLDEAALQRFGQLLALFVRAGDTIALSGDLGAGKTTLARALIRAFAADGDLEVASPTFALVQGYEAARGRIDHFDLYRLRDAGEADELGLGHAGGDAVRVVEWPERYGRPLARDLITIRLDESGAGDARTIDVEARGTVAGRLRRLDETRCFLAANGWSGAAISYLQGDASARAYARLTEGQRRAVLMDSPRQADGPIVRDGKPYSRIAHLAEDVRPFVAVDHALRAAGLSAPQILAEDLDRGFLLLEDLGDRVFGRENDGGPHQVELWTAALDMLAAFRRAAPAMVMPVLPDGKSGDSHELPALDATILGIELDLLPQWYWPEMMGRPMTADVRDAYDAAWRPVIDLLLAAPKGWILRDVHSPNLIWLPERQGIARVGVIDFQDAIAGPWAHDVMSLLQDARIDVPEPLEEELLTRYVTRMTGAADFEAEAFLATYACYGALRATRLIGLFVRLLRRDHKPGYLAHLPRNWGYLERNLRHPVLRPVAAWYEQHLPQHIRTRAIVP